ncbi:MAG: class I SAM-dependent methyltransferase [Flavobacteriales bacterium]|nr:class I SAM-dependent methyltransferase [Flavobacteriales bacterium]
MDQHKKSNCRYCNTPLSEPFLELGSMPLANSFLKKEELNDKEFTCPLSLVYCETCSLVQLSHVVPAELMFSHYLYVSSTSATFREHFKDYAKDAIARSTASGTRLAVDIGSNDGLLLHNFVKEGINAVGVDPATNLSDQANEEGLTSINRYFDAECVRIITENHGKADIITANNVFAHIDDSQSVCKNVSDLLSDDGMFIIEFPSLHTMYSEMFFDMIYHEHLSYIGLEALQHLYRNHNLEIFDVIETSAHGGSRRVFAQKIGAHNEVSDNVAETLEAEFKACLSQNFKHTEFAEAVSNIRTNLRTFVSEAKKQGKKIAGYGAPAKGNTIINYCNFNSNDIDYIVDDNALKQNMFTPGAHIPVFSSKILHDDPPDMLIIFAWNFAEEIIHKIHFLQESGTQFIIPLPIPRIIE